MLLQKNDAESKCPHRFWLSFRSACFCQMFLFQLIVSHVFFLHFEAPLKKLLNCSWDFDPECVYSIYTHICTSTASCRNTLRPTGPPLRSQAQTGTTVMAVRRQNKGTVDGAAEVISLACVRRATTTMELCVSLTQGWF